MISDDDGNAAIGLQTWEFLNSMKNCAKMIAVSFQPFVVSSISLILSEAERTIPSKEQSASGASENIWPIIIYAQS